LRRCCLLLGCGSLLLSRSRLLARRRRRTCRGGTSGVRDYRGAAPDTKDRLGFGHQFYGQKRHIGKKHKRKGNGNY
jgi:hypothetical protein